MLHMNRCVFDRQRYMRYSIAEIDDKYYIVVIERKMPGGWMPDFWRLYEKTQEFPPSIQCDHRRHMMFLDSLPLISYHDFLPGTIPASVDDFLKDPQTWLMIRLL